MTASLLATDLEQEVRAEMRRANEKHGEQLDAPSFGRNLGYGVPRADAAKRTTDTRFRRGVGSWADILVEEVCEALEEVDDPEALRTELVQVAATALRWINKLDQEGS